MSIPAVDSYLHWYFQVIYREFWNKELSAHRDSVGHQASVYSHLLVPLFLQLDELGSYNLHEYV